MTLKEWRTKYKLTIIEAVKRLGLSSSGHLSLLERGATSPTLRTVDRVARATKGAVSRLDWPEEKPDAEA
jgi:transcriptional regulator with XRE-family HTH domain